ncbi:hypothetical protein [Afipia sp. DC4300-2b1]|uniref:hypothetical protein n=1 Tax=Afipia sp. DC4300-2b1 TaxID=2804672 RepID=UPI003CF1DDC3
MRWPLRLALMIPLTLSAAAALAVDRGQFGDVPEHIRKWFKDARSPAGVPCCDVSDGHRTDYDVREGSYWVPIEGSWWLVPEKAIIRTGGNPTGGAVVWYVTIRGNIEITCFVPADGS